MSQENYGSDVPKGRQEYIISDYSTSTREQK
jgi:hypothetical protein